MSKYFDKLLKLNESLDKELKDKGLVKEDEDETQVSVPADSLTDDQKKGILSDTLKDAGLKVDDKVVDELVKSPEEMAGVQKILGDEQKNESAEELGDISEEVVIRMDDDDLDMHGYVSTRGGKELVLTDNMEEAQKFQHEELGQNRIEAICNKFHYDPSTFKTVSVDPRADEPYEDDDSDKWISLNPLDPTATTIG